MKIWIAVIGVGLYLYLVFIYFEAVADLGEAVIKVLCRVFHKVDQLVHKN